MSHFIDTDLIRRYSTQVPRYTSYPTAVEFSPSVSHSQWRGHLDIYARGARKTPIALYCHIPFCRSLCYFCACNKIIAKDRSAVTPYLVALEREIGHYSEFLGSSQSVVQMHWGGGSPNFLEPDEIARLAGVFRSRFPHFIENADVSIELDPRTTSDDQLRVLHEVGFNRISLGVQDFDPKVQEAVHRHQSFEETSHLINYARALGFSSINLDLIYGLPFQTVESFSLTLERVQELQPDRIALYGYAHVTWVSKVQNVFSRAPLPSPDERVSLFSRAVETLTASGYQHIGMDHFALSQDGLARALADGSLHRNFMGYATHRTDALIGVGVSAISSIPTAYSQNYRDIASYQSALSEPRLPTERGVLLSPEDQWRAAIISRLMCRGEVNLGEFEREHSLAAGGATPADPELLNQLAVDKLVALHDNQITVTAPGRFLLRNVASVFDAYLARHRVKNVYSQAI